MTGATIDPIVREIEGAIVEHWSLLGGWPGAQLVATAPIWSGAD